MVELGAFPLPPPRRKERSHSMIAYQVIKSWSACEPSSRLLKEPALAAVQEVI